MSSSILRIEVLDAVPVVCFHDLLCMTWPQGTGRIVLFRALEEEEGKIILLELSLCLSVF